MAWSWAFLFVGLLASRAHAQDRWLGSDKAAHFGASAVLASGGYAAATLIVEEPWQRAAVGGGFSLTLGVAKELYDATGRGDPSLRDLTWDVIGCAFGVGMSLLIDYALRPPDEPAPVPLRAAAW